MFKEKSDIYMKVILIILTGLFIVSLLNLILKFSIEKSQLELMRTDIKIKKETLLGDLLYQYYVDIADCIQNTELSEKQCISEVNQSNLAEKIIEWGGAEYLREID